MILKQALAAAISHLDDSAVGSPRMNGEVLLMFTLARDRAYLYSHPEHELTEDEQARYDEAVERRASGYPSQYITGHQEFWGLDLIVTPAVLIPRPETEHIVEVVTEIARSADYKGEMGRPKLIDVGTGSGAIALALGKELPKAEVMAVDVSSEALEVARANAVRLQLDARIRFQQSNVLESITRDGSFDFVVSKRRVVVQVSLCSLACPALRVDARIDDQPSRPPSLITKHAERFVRRMVHPHFDTETFTIETPSFAER